MGDPHEDHELFMESLAAFFADDAQANLRIDKSADATSVSVSIPFTPVAEYDPSTEDDQRATYHLIVDGKLPATVSTDACHPPAHAPEAARSSGPSHGKDEEIPTDVIPKQLHEVVVVRHLHPIRLSVQLRNSPPTKCGAPTYVLQAPWLDAIWEPGHHDPMVTLRKSMDALWDESDGDITTAVFAWIDFLQSDALAELFPACEESSAVAKLHFKCEIESASALDSGSFGSLPTVLERLVMFDDMAAYDDDVEEVRWMTATHECAICEEEVLGSDMARPACGHVCCSTCMQHMVKLHVEQGQVQRLNCPESGCGMYLGDDVVRASLLACGQDAPRLLERWQEFAVKKGLESMADMIMCPECGGVAFKEDPTLAQCAQCGCFICPKCMAASHGETPCLDFSQQAIKLMAAHKGGKLNYSELQRKQKQLAEVKKSERLVQQTSKICPNCGIRVAKNGGCNKMTCSNCRLYFCYLCNEPISGYDHFSNSSCVLFGEDDIRRFNRQMDDAQFRDRYARRNGVAFVPILHFQQGGVPPPARRGMFGRRGLGIGRQGVRPADRPPGARCPNCRFHNAKTTPNNHATCSNCHFKFCFNCSAPVRNVAQHYGKSKRCKQHS